MCPNDITAPSAVDAARPTPHSSRKVRGPVVSNAVANSGAACARTSVPDPSLKVHRFGITRNALASIEAQKAMEESNVVE